MVMVFPFALCIAATVRTTSLFEKLILIIKAFATLIDDRLALVRQTPPDAIAGWALPLLRPKAAWISIPHAGMIIINFILRERPLIIDPGRSRIGR
jgi:hypothetical protein